MDKRGRFRLKIPVSVRKGRLQRRRLGGGEEEEEEEAKILKTCEQS